MPNLTLRPIAYGTGLTLSTDGKLRIEPNVPRHREILIHERSGLWSINEGESAYVLDQDGDWVREPPPSERDDDWHARCRYASLEEAADWLRQCAQRSNA